MCCGVLKRICHWGPLVALGIIKAVTMATVHCLSQWWPPQKSWGGMVFFSSFMSSSVLTLYFFLQAMYTGPGLLGQNWVPKKEEEKKFLQFCGTCEGFKAPRAHHCRKCGHCVMKMDHHCPWINNCVGHKNHAYFTMFLFWAVAGCTLSTVVLASSIYRAIHRTWYIYYGTGNEPVIYMSLWGLVTCMFVLGLAIGVVLAVGMLLFFQIRAILRNRTGIEDWILEKAIHRRCESDKPFIYPYDLGRWNNFFQVLNLWCEPTGDGVEWPVREGCHQYTLTVEQREQKAEKRARSREYLVSENFSGWWFPCTKGCDVCCHPPCSDEPRITLEVGDTVIVTRWKKYWLYGERFTKSKDSSSPSTKKVRHRGWFPRRCAVEVYSSENDLEGYDEMNSLPVRSKGKEDTSDSKKKR
ncbi:palmitoyltransferase ZDHHC6 [Oratosquilla oratoria]|uniref:palmitoyltransferase ZDHHC6 n=1 Tax=Oratosquilla oratoria TaxID=337810 RepID=UPI003F75905A